MTRGVVSSYKIHHTQSTASLDSEYILFSYERNIMNNFGLRKLPLSPFPLPLVTPYPLHDYIYEQVACHTSGTFRGRDRLDRMDPTTEGSKNSLRSVSDTRMTRG